MWKGRGGRYRDITAINWGGGEGGGRGLTEGAWPRKAPPLPAPTSGLSERRGKSPKTALFRPKIRPSRLEILRFQPSGALFLPKNPFFYPKTSRPAPKPVFCPQNPRISPQKALRIPQCIPCVPNSPHFFPKKSHFSAPKSHYSPPKCLQHLSVPLRCPKFQSFRPKLGPFPPKIPSFHPISPFISPHIPSFYPKSL